MTVKWNMCIALIDTHMKVDCTVLAAPVGIQKKCVTAMQMCWSLTSQKINNITSGLALDLRESELA